MGDKGNVWRLTAKEDGAPPFRIMSWQEAPEANAPREFRILVTLDDNCTQGTAAHLKSDGSVEFDWPLVERASALSWGHFDMVVALSKLILAAREVGRQEDTDGTR